MFKHSVIKPETMITGDPGYQRIMAWRRICREIDAFCKEKERLDLVDLVWGPGGILMAKKKGQKSDGKQ